MITRTTVFAAILLLTSCNSEPVSEKPVEKKDTAAGVVLDVGREIEPLDKSPLDIAWYPQNYPLEKFKGTIKGNAVMRIIYSRPHLHGRKIGIDVALPDTLWRMGANENNEIEFFEKVSIGGQNLPAGKYIIFCQPHKESWDIYLSKDIYSWGLRLDTLKPVAKTNVPVEKNSFSVESLTMQFTKNTSGADLHVYWGDVTIKLPVKFEQ